MRGLRLYSNSNTELWGSFQRLTAKGHSTTSVKPSSLAPDLQVTLCLCQETRMSPAPKPLLCEELLQCPGQLGLFYAQGLGRHCPHTPSETSPSGIQKGGFKGSRPGLTGRGHSF